MILIQKDTIIKDILDICRENPIDVNIRFENNIACISFKESGGKKPYESVAVGSWHGITEHTKYEVGANVTEYLNNIYSKHKFNKIEKLLKNNNISQQDIENYLITLEDNE